MNEAEKIRKRLERYDAPSVQTEEVEESTPVKQGDIWDSLSQLPEDWQPRPRYQSAYEPGSDPATFEVGGWYHKSRWKNGRLERQAIVHPRYPEPGALITPEIEKVYWQELTAWCDARRALDDVLFLTKHRLAKNPYFLDSNSDQWLAREWNFLLGVWSAKGITPPSKEQIEKWAQTR